MKFSTNNFLSLIKNIVMGGGADSAGYPKHDSGFLKEVQIGLHQITSADQLTATGTVFTTYDIGGTADSVLQAVTEGGTAQLTTGDGAKINDNFEDIAVKINAIVADIAAIKTKIGLEADETNAKVLKVQEAVDTIGVITWTVPRDYDEATDELKVYVLASQLTQSTDDDVQLDAQVYVKTAGSALGSDLDPTKPSTVLSTTEQWVEFDLSANDLERDDVVYFKLITDGHNDTNGEEVLVHDIKFVYRSTLVSYDLEDANGNALR